MVSQILISIIFFFILMYVSVNLLGFFVRGLFSNPELDSLKRVGSDFIKYEIGKSQRGDTWVTIIALTLNIIFFFLLFHFWNIGVVVAAVIIMAGRLPDLLWEIKHGRKTDPNLMKKDVWYYVSAFLPWTAFPILYFSLYHI